MPRTRLFGSSIATKLWIGATGLFLVLYLLVHVGGNLIVFLGPDTFNRYSHTLLNNPLIWLIEVVLVVAFVLHVVKTLAMYLANQKARPVRYEAKRPAGPPSRKTFASSTMIVSGLWLLVFIVIHVKTFKFGPDYRAAGAEGFHDLYRVEMENFSSPLAVAFYVLSMLVVGSHLWHGASSACQSLGIVGPRWTPRVLAAGKVLAVLIAGGFIVIAVWAHFGGAGS
jgi:succinate dehydrogenase / fumarate reductase cytochrome b subunit